MWFPMNGPSNRMLQLLSLLQNGRHWTGPDLAKRLDTSPRTLRRDIDRLRELGYPVESLRGPGGSYRLVAGQAMPPLLLSDDEAVATVIGLRFAALAHVGGVTESAATALGKLEQVLPTRLRHRMEALSASTEAATRGPYSTDLSTLQRLASCAHEHLDVRFEYSDKSGSISHRRVEPYRQVLVARHWYLLGWDRDRADWRTYRLDRIVGVTVPGSTFAPRPLPTDGPVSFVRRQADAPVDPQHGVVRFDAPFAVVSERLAAEAGSLEPIDDGSCRYVTAADSWEWLALTLAAVGVPYSIEGPADLQKHTRQLAHRLAQAAGH